MHAGIIFEPRDRGLCRIQIAVPVALPTDSSPHSMPDSKTLADKAIER
jgi:hypothetical protein